MALKFAERPGANIRSMNLSVEEWRVVSYISPKNTMRQIARTTKMSDVEIRRIVYSLLQAGLVELTRPEGGLPTPPPSQTSSRLQTPQPSVEEQKGLLNKLINRIRSM
jgi:hypothetical protein